MWYKVLKNQRSLKNETYRGYDAEKVLQIEGWEQQNRNNKNED